MNTPPTTWAEAGYGLRSAGWALLAFAVIDFCLAPLWNAATLESWTAVLACVLLGSVLAQATLLSAYLVWGLGPFWQRLIIHWCMVLLLWGISSLGYCWVFGFGKWGTLDPSVPGVLWELPIFLLALQTPLWITRGLGLRLHHPSNSARPSPLSIADLLQGTTVIAASLGSALAGRDAASLPIQSMPRVIVIGLIIWAAASLPLCLAMLRIRDLKLAFAATGVYGLLLATGTTIFILAIGGAANIGMWPVIMAGLFELSCVSIVAGCLALARSHGWQLMTGREAASTHSAVAAPPGA